MISSLKSQQDVTPFEEDQHKNLKRQSRWCMQYIAHWTTVEFVLCFPMFRALGTSLHPHLITNKLSKVRKEQGEFL